MRTRNLFLIAVGMIFLIIILVSWFTISEWQDMNYGFFTLVGAVLAAAVPILSGIVSIWKDLYGNATKSKNVIKEIEKIQDSGVIQISDTANIQSLIGQQNITIYTGNQLKTDQNHGNQSYEETVEKQEIHTSTLGILPDYYVARESLLQSIKAYMGVGEQNSKPVRYLVIQGIAGTGKSMLVKGILEDPSLRYIYPDGILTAFLGPRTNGENIQEKPLVNFLRVFQTDPKEFPTIDEKVEYLRNVISRKRILIVVDDVWDTESISEIVKIVGSGSTLLLTTRSRDLVARLGINNLVIVDKLDKEEARELIIKKLGKQPSSSEWESSIYKFCEYVHWHAMAISLACAQVSVGDLRWESILDAFEKEQGLRNIDFENPANREESISQTLQLSIQTLNDLEKRRYAWLGVFAPGVPFTIEDAASFFIDLQNNEKDKQEQTSKEDLGPLFKALTSEQIQDIRTTFSRFYRKGLIEILPGEQYLISLHPLLQDFCVSMLNDMNELKNAFSLHAVLYIQLLPMIIERVHGLEYWHQHGELALHRAWRSIQNPSHELIFNSDIFLITAITVLGKYWIKHGEYEKTIDWITRTLSLDSEISSDSLLELKLDLSSAYIELGQYTQGESLLVEISELPLQDTDKVSFLNLWGLYHLHMTKIKEAIEIYKELIELTQSLKDRENEGKAYGNLGNAYIASNMPEEAIEAFTFALKIGEEINDAQGLGKRFGNLARAHYMLATKNLWIAARLNKAGIDAAKYYGDTKSQGVHTLTLAQISMQQGRFELARICAEEAKTIFESIGSPISKNAEFILGRLDGKIDDQPEFIPPHFMLEYTEAACKGDRISEFYVNSFSKTVEQNNELVHPDYLQLIRSLMLVLKGERKIEKVAKGLSANDKFSIQVLLLRLTDSDQAKFFNIWSTMIAGVIENKPGAIDIVNGFISSLSMENNLPNFVTSDHINGLKVLVAGERNPEIVAKGLNEFYTQATRYIITHGEKPTLVETILDVISTHYLY